VTGKNRITIYGPKDDGTYVPLRICQLRHHRQRLCVRPAHLFTLPLYIGRARWVIIESPIAHATFPPEICHMAKGTVKWFNPTKGYGFIQPQGGGKDVFVHISAVERAGLSTLNEGQAVEYEEVSNRGKTSAENLKFQR
jgi:cold shock protein